jgi:hypothetical protein
LAGIDVTTIHPEWAQASTEGNEEQQITTEDAVLEQPETKTKRDKEPDSDPHPLGAWKVTAIRKVREPSPEPEPEQEQEQIEEAEKTGRSREIKDNSASDDGRHKIRTKGATSTPKKVPEPEPEPEESHPVSFTFKKRVRSDSAKAGQKRTRFGI